MRRPNLSPSRVASSSPPAPPPTMTTRCRVRGMSPRDAVFIPPAGSGRVSFSGTSSACTSAAVITPSAWAVSAIVARLASAVFATSAAFS